MIDYSFIFECSARAYIILEVKSKNIIVHNKIAEQLFGMLDEGTNIEDIFRYCPMTLSEMIEEYEKIFRLDDVTKRFENLLTVKWNGEKQLVDFTMGFMNPEKSELLLEFAGKSDDRERFLIEMLDHTSNAMFLAKIDMEFSVYYANHFFYEAFADDKETFEKHFGNSCISSILDVNKEGFVQDVLTHLKDHPNFQRDIHVTTASGVKKWYHLELQYQKLSGGRKVYQGILLPIPTPMLEVKQQEDYNRYFHAIQELSAGTLLFLNVEEMVATHHSEYLRDAGFPTIIENFPHCILHLIHPEDITAFEEYAEKMKQGTVESCDFRYRNATGNFGWARVKNVAIYDESGKISEVVVKIVDIEQEKMRTLPASVDPITHALHTEFLKEQITLILQESEEDTSHAFMFMDLDDFKAVSEQFGTEFSDFLLGQLGMRMKKQIRGDDVFGRIGEDGFIFFLKNFSKFEILLRKADGLRNTITEPFDNGENQHTIHGSIGISVYPLHGTTYDELLEHAGNALL